MNENSQNTFPQKITTPKQLKPALKHAKGRTQCPPNLLKQHENAKKKKGVGGEGGGDRLPIKVGNAIQSVTKEGRIFERGKGGGTTNVGQVLINSFANILFWRQGTDTAEAGRWRHKDIDGKSKRSETRWQIERFLWQIESDVENEEKNTAAANHHKQQNEQENRKTKMQGQRQRTKKTRKTNKKRETLRLVYQ